MTIATGEYLGVDTETPRHIDNCGDATGEFADFTSVLATALANAQARDELRRQARERAALQRVAALVAQGTPPAAIFSAVSREVEALFDAAAAAVVKFEHDPPSLSIVGTGDHMQSSAIRSRYPLDEGYASSEVFRTGRSARREARSGAVLDGPVYGPARDVANGGGLRVTSAVASPLIVAGELWGAVSVSAGKSLPSDTEARLERFAEMVVTAIANADSRQALATLNDEQTALRRVAALVARGVPAAQIFMAVTEEVARLFGEGLAAIGRFDRDAPIATIVGLTKPTDGFEIGTRIELRDGPAAQVYATGRAARADRADASTTMSPLARRLAIVSSVSCPIIVEGQLWGAMNALSATKPLPPETERRLQRFSELVATAIANAESRSELAASRRRLVAASDEARRRIERNLHDGTQQRLVSLALAVRATEADLPAGLHSVRSELSQIAAGLGAAVVEIQEITRGVHPANLEQRGLCAALRTLARRSSIAVELDVASEVRLPAPVEIAAYYVACEALANAAKHAQATRIELSVVRRKDSVIVSILDDGIGGADPARGSGLVGLTDRVEALGGSLEVRSPSARGTRITATLPIATDMTSIPD